MKKTYYSNGKLLLTGEYVVLDGALALALPTKFGQDLIVETSDSKEIHWTSYDADGSIWFEDTFLYSEIENKISFTEQPVKNTLIEILHEAGLLNPSFLKHNEGFRISTHLTFPKFWGLGTSSTLINNIAQWLEIDAFALLKNSFGGSGYDIACAQNDTPILYCLDSGKPLVKSVAFVPECRNHLYFVYLNQKQNSKSAIASYQQKRTALDNIILQTDKITTALLQTNDGLRFQLLLQEHEHILSALLELPTVKENLFPDFQGSVKSLGAWGGDFILAYSKKNPTSYFHEKGFQIVIPYADMIL